jgi:hypothetical protein
LANSILMRDFGLFGVGLTGTTICHVATLTSLPLTSSGCGGRFKTICAASMSKSRCRVRFRRFERVVDEPLELDVFYVGARLAANEVEILAIALAAIAEA